MRAASSPCREYPCERGREGAVQRNPRGTSFTSNVTSMHRLALRKPDGRELTLYSRAPLTGHFDAPSPFAEPLQGKPHMRWHPLRGEWVTYAAYRQDRTFLPPPEYNPFAVTVEQGNPTEV